MIKGGIRTQANLVSVGGNVTGFVSGALSRILNMVLVPVIAFYFLMDKEKIYQFTVRNLPEKNKETWMTLGREIDKSMQEFIRGRLLMAVFVGVVTAICLLILGLITHLSSVLSRWLRILFLISTAFIPAVIILYPCDQSLWVGILYVFIQCWKTMW